MKCVIDTHFLLWIAVGDHRLDEFPWIDAYGPWGVSPVSFLEIAFLHEVGKLRVDIDAFRTAVSDDPRFVVDEVPLLNLISRALPLNWTRDPFDRLLCAHSAARRKPFITMDRRVRQNHELIVKELR